MADRLRTSRPSIWKSPAVTRTAGSRCSGTPARFSSPLGVYGFQKRSSLIEVSEAGAQVLGKIASVLAHGEGLQAHARAAEMRLNKPLN